MGPLYRVQFVKVPFEQLEEATQRHEWSTQLMAHMQQKLLLELIGLTLALIGKHEVVICL